MDNKVSSKRICVRLSVIESERLNKLMNYYKKTQSEIIKNSLFNLYCSKFNEGDKK